MMQARGMKVPGDSASVQDPRDRDIRDSRDSNDKRNSDVKDPHIGDRTQSLESLAARTHGTDTPRTGNTDAPRTEESTRTSPPRGNIVMHQYMLADGRVMYFPTYESDIELQKEGEMTKEILPEKLQ